jgi:hypothetical protein
LSKSIRNILPRAEIESFCGPLFPPRQMDVVGSGGQTMNWSNRLDCKNPQKKCESASAAAASILIHCASENAEKAS